MSKFLGTVGERRTFILKVKSVFAKTGEYGPFHVTKLTDWSGNAVTWFKSGAPLEVGAVYEVTATVKKHDTWSPGATKFGGAAKAFHSTVITRGTATRLGMEFPPVEEAPAAEAASPVAEEAKKDTDEDVLAAFAKCRDALGGF